MPYKHQIWLIKGLTTEGFGKNKCIYRHCSPLAWIYYYADEKYNISEREIGEEEIGRIIDELLPRIVEAEVREFAASKYGLVESVVEGNEMDVDACLLKFRKPDILIEVKWAKNISKEDVRKAERNLSSISAREKWLFVPDKNALKFSSELKVVDMNDLL